MRVFRSLRAQLTVWYCLALAVGLTIFGVLLFGLAEHHLTQHFDESLRSRGVKALRILASQKDPHHLGPEQMEELNQLGKVVIQHNEGQGEELIYRSPELPSTWTTEAILGLPALDAAGPAIDSRDLGGVRWRVYTLHFQLKNGRSGLVRILENLGDVGATLHRLLIDFLHLAPAGLLVSFLGGYWISGRALSPLVRVIDQAREIEASKLDRRLPDQGLDDEIGSLVKTLNRVFARLESSFEAMKRFTADASHELRSPLATVRNTIDVTLSQPRSLEEHREAMISIGEEVDRIRSIVEDLLLLARADAGRVVMRMAPVRLDHIVEAEVEARQFQAEERGTTLRLLRSLEDEIPGDERWLHQVLGNLLDNALKFTPPGGSIEVDMDRGDGWMTVSVGDTGPGIPEEDLDRVFERFFRSDTSRSRAHVPGVGLGLAIAAWVVREHGGRIQAANRATSGATFTVTLPMSAAHG